MATTETYSTSTFIYTMSRREVYEPPLMEPCKLVIAKGEEAGIRLIIPCFNCSGFSNHEVFLRRCRRKYCELLLRCYRFLSPRRIGVVVEKLTALVELANANHNCNEVRFRTTHVVDINIHPRETAEEERAIQESFNAVVPAVVNPATRESVEDLFRARSQELEAEGDRFEIGWTDVDRDCVICMDQIVTRGRSLTMPCAHVFHDDCLVGWLNNSHVCPLCRYEMPR